MMIFHSYVSLPEGIRTIYVGIIGFESLVARKTLHCNSEPVFDLPEEPSH